MQLALLGPLEVIDDPRPIAVHGSRLRSLLVRLAVDAPHPVSAGELIEAIWGLDPPEEATNALQSLVSRLRRALGGADSVPSAATGYRLRIETSDLDLHRFDELAAAAARDQRDGRPAEALQAADQALGLWRGEPLVDAGDAAYAETIATAYRQQRLEIIGTRIDALLDLGRGQEVIGDLGPLIAAYPLRERFVAQQLRALASAGRTNEALAAYERCRTYLADEFGSDPGPQLQQLHLALLRGELQPERTPAAGPSRTPRTNIRPGLTSFVGRDAELAQLADDLAAHRLVTIVGPGGAGKTRTAAEAATRWLETTGQPAWLVELAPVGTGENIPVAILAALGLRDQRLLDPNDRTPVVAETQRLIDHLSGRPCLLILDNCEHLVDAAAELAEDLLSRVPGLRILTTSREPLAITGEVLCPLPPLNVPPADCPLDQAERYPAVRLWQDRASAIDTAFVLDHRTLGPVLEIVRRLDGLPLAIELAAARLRALPVADIARLLSDRFRLLTGGSRTSLPRHRTLRAVVEWSWDLLTESERLLTMRLAVFPAGAGIESTTAVCADDHLRESAISEVLINLAEKSLLQRSDSSPVRYSMLETIREYGLERLSESGALTTARERHGDYFLDLVGQLEPALRDRRQLDARAALDLERDNIFAAIRYLLDNERAHDGLLMILAMFWYFQVQDHENELSYWLDQALEAVSKETRADDTEPDLLLDYGRIAASVARMSAEQDPDFSELTDQVAEILPRLESGPEPPFASLNALRMMLPIYLESLTAQQMPAPDDDAEPPASPLLRPSRLPAEALDQLTANAERATDPWTRGLMYVAASGIAENDGDLAAMDRYSIRAQAEFDACGDRWGLSSTLNFRAQVLTLRGDVAGAIELLQRSLQLSPMLGAENDALIIHLRLAVLNMRADDLPAARRHLVALRQPGEPSAMDPERLMFADAIEAELLWLEDDHDGALATSARLRDGLSGEDASHRYGFSAHRVAICSASIAAVECAAAVESGVDTEPGRRHLDRGLADLLSGYPATLQTGDIPMISEFANVLADLAMAGGLPRRAAYLMGIGAGLIGVDAVQDSRRARTLGVLRHRFDLTGLERDVEAGRTLSRTAALAALDPQSLIAELAGPDPAAGPEDHSRATSSRWR